MKTSVETISTDQIFAWGTRTAKSGLSTLGISYLLTTLRTKIGKPKILEKTGYKTFFEKVIKLPADNSNQIVTSFNHPWNQVTVVFEHDISEKQR